MRVVYDVQFYFLGSFEILVQLRWLQGTKIHIEERASGLWNECVYKLWDQILW